MLKDVIRQADLAQWAEMGLVFFLFIFVGAVAWALTRKRTEVTQWAALPLEDSAPLKEPRRE